MKCSGFSVIFLCRMGNRNFWSSIKRKKFIDVGFLFGPWCPSYGFGAVGFALFLPELKEQPVFLFAGGVILSFIITSLTGLTLERIFHQKWKDYSRRRFNFGGYVNLPYTVVWGCGGTVVYLDCKSIFK